MTAKKKTSKKAPYTHIDRSNGQFLREKDLRKDKPHIGPVSGVAAVERMTTEEATAANA